MSSSPAHAAAQPPSGQVAAQLERILSAPVFRDSQRLSAFLRFCVETTLAGRSYQLKEHVIGVEAFGRPRSYSPQVDPIVRIMAGRLRGKLAEYYSESGQSDSIAIDLPRGAYVPRFAWRAQVAPQVRASPVPPSQSVGREHETHQLQTAFGAVSQGTGLMLSVSGDAGMGKTTLVEEFLRDLEVKGSAIVSRGRCSQRLAQTDAFAPMLDALDDLCRPESGAEAAELLRKAAPSWYRQVAPSADAAEPKSGSHERMRREFLAFFEALSGTLPVVLFLDDLHWADASTCDLLAYLGSRLRNVRLLILVAYQPGLVQTPGHPFLPQKLALEHQTAGRNVHLGLLEPKDVKAYIEMKFAGHSFPREFVDVVYQRTEGNPLFLTDLLRYLVETKVLAEDNGKWILSQSTAEVRKVIPAGTQAMINLKIASLGEDDRSILLCGSVQGMEFDSAVVASVLSFDPVAVEERLAELEAVHRLVRKIGERDQPGVQLSVRYRFIHAFYQNALYASLTPSRRSASSLTVARALSGFAGDASRTMAADLAMLFESGRDYGQAAHYFLRAARGAASVFAYPEAALLCERGLRSLAAVSDSKERDEQELRFSLTLGMALMSTRGYAAPEAERTHRCSRELCLKLGDIRRLVPVLWGIHTCEVNGGRLTEALETAMEMRKAADALQYPPAIVESLHALGTTLAFLGRLPEARQALEGIFELAPVSKHEFRGSLYVLDPLVTSLSMLARLLTLMGHLDLSMEKAAESLALANRLAHPHSLAYATFWVGWIFHTRGDHAQSCPHLESAMALGQSHGYPLIVEWGRVVHGSALAHLGKYAEGIAEIRNSINLQEAMGSRVDRSYCLTLLAEALLAHGETAEALQLCDDALELVRSTEGRCYEPETRRVRAEALLTAYGEERQEEAEAELAGAIQQAQQAECRLLHLRAAVSYATFKRRTGDTAEARNVLEDIVRWFPPDAECPPLALAQKLLA
ncbi:MAG: AAA family ATPase [Bryobacterales bacterium]|nr:AAA family ATPase [Bryobacterales bacterium]